MGAWGTEELEALYARLQKPLYNVVFRLVWNREDATELVQETFVKLWNKRRKIRGETVEALAYRIALNLARSLLRKRRVRSRLGFGAEADVDEVVLPRATGEDRALEAERAVEVREAVAGLPPDLREVLLLTELSELRYDQIAVTLGIAEGTVGSRRSRALKRLRLAMGEAP
ncbi:hypothetical protein ABI59_01830 [Acidobacteria bacterium Mor1]|nr:hypothetical protein ABI59_01830 [Acidobacteria bacterium Mor1]